MAREFDAQGNRIDVHAPKNFDPAEYVIVGYADLKPISLADFGGTYTAAAIEAARLMEQDRKAHVKSLFGTEYPSHSCAHCGHPHLRWVACAQYLPTGERLVIGEICADTRMSLESKAEFQMSYIRSHANNVARHLERLAQVAKAQATYRVENADVADFLMALPEDESFSFLRDMRANFVTKYGSLTTNQTAGVRKCMANAAKRAAAVTTAPQAAPSDLQTGNGITVSGEVVSVKWQESDFGTTQKMLVVLADGNKVWSTVPSCICNVTKGDHVEFVANVEASRNDPHFGIGKRPRNAKLTQATEGVAC